MMSGNNVYSPPDQSLSPNSNLCITIEESSEQLVVVEQDGDDDLPIVGANPPDDLHDCDGLLDDFPPQSNESEKCSTASPPPATGMEFDSYDAAYSYYNSYARDLGFAIRVKSSWTKRNSKEKRGAVLCCNCEGFKTVKEPNSTRRKETRTGCQAMIRLRLIELDRWKVDEVKLEHNHSFDPERAHNSKSHKKTFGDGAAAATKRKHEPPLDVQVRTIKLYRTNAVDSNGETSDDHLHSSRRLDLRGGGGFKVLQDFFFQSQLTNPNFFYSMDLGDDGCLRNVFWIESRARAAYSHFSDVVVFDTTCLSNAYELPLVAFVGINHHGDPILLGCGLVADQTPETYVWLFRAWLTCVSGRPPLTFVTEHCKSIQTAVSEVFPRAHHRLSLTHVLQCVVGVQDSESFRMALNRVVYGYLKVEEFEVAWEEMIIRFGLTNHETIRGLFQDREQWAPVYLKDTFLAGALTFRLGNAAAPFIFSVRLESKSDEDHLSENDITGLENMKRPESKSRFSKLALQKRDMGDEAWLDRIIWESDKELSRSQLIFDLQDEQMVFEILDNEETKNLQLHAGAMIVSRSSKSNDEILQEGCESNSGWQFNISNDKFYMNGKSSQQLQANTNKSGVHSLRVFHSAPAIKLQTMKNRLSNKDIANFHRPKAVWYPHDNELAIKQQGKLPSRGGSMKIVIKSLGGKGSKLHVGIEESVSSLKAKASKKLDFKETEAVKMFYMGKELEDENSLAVQNVQPNSLVHLVRTKVHLWPLAQKLPGENKALRPPGAFKRKADLSTKDGHVFLLEYCEERPLMLSNAGMGANLCTYYQKSSSEDQRGNLLRNQSDTLGNVMILEPGDKSPFLGEIQPGCCQSSVETNMYKAPVFPHRLQSTDYLLVRSPKGKLSLRRIDKIAVVGQQEPRMEVMSPGSKNLQTYLVNRMLVYVYREFMKSHSIAADELSFLFSNLTDAVVRRNMKLCAGLKRDKNGQPCWYKRPDFQVPPENELKKLVAPEHVCSYESMLAGLYRLKHLGITRFTLPASISAALTQLPDEAIALAAASHIERELQITPWNLSSNFVACTNQDRANIERLEITGVGDPSGRGLGFSFVKAAPKAPAAAGHMKKKAAAGRGAPTVTGTDADLRRLSMEAAREVLIKFNVPDEIIAKQTRWHRIAMIRKLSSEQAASGVKVDPTTIGKYARGQRMSFLQMQQQAREKCQEIWDRQLSSLSAYDGDENESENEANSDLDSFAGDLENLLDAEEGGEGEESNISKNDKLDGVKGLKMRRRPSQVETDEEIEDEATEYAELCRLLMQDEDQKKKKKKIKAVGEGMGSFPPPRPSIGFQIAEPVRKATFIDKNPIATQPDASFLVNESTVKDTRNWQVDSPILKTPKGKQVKDNGNSLGPLKKVKILNENLKVFKEKKSARENFVCGACGQYGHMRTNKHCPRYRENTDPQPEGVDMEKSVGKPSTSELSGQAKIKPIKSSKAAPKSAIKVTVDATPKGDSSTSKTGGLPLKFRYGIPAGAMSDTPGSEAPGSSEQAAVSDIDTGTKTTSKISKLKISSKAKPKESKVESDRPLPTYSRERGESESHKPCVSGNQAASSRHTISILQPSLSMDRDQAESRRPHLVIRPPTEREQPQKKLVIKRSKEITDHDMSSLEESPRFESRKTKRMAELTGFQRQQSFRVAENSLERRPKEDRVWWDEEEISRRRDYDDMNVTEEPNEIAEIRRYEEVLRSEREEEERQKAKNKKKKKKMQPELVEGYLEDYPPRRNNNDRRGRNVRSRYVSDFEMNGADYAPQPKRRKKGEVGLANILETIVDTLRLKEEVSGLFLKPVSKKDAPDYFDIVKRPMDLSTIRDKVRKIEYRNREQFRHDVWQIQLNAHLYNNNGRNPGIPPLADQLLEICDYLLEDYGDQLAEAEKGIDR